MSYGGRRISQMNQKCQTGVVCPFFHGKNTKFCPFFQDIHTYFCPFFQDLTLFFPGMTHRIIGSSDHRNLDGIQTDVFWGCFARNLLWKSLIKYGLWPEINNHRILDGYQTETKSLRKSLTKMRSNTSLLGEGFIMDRLRLDILTIILNKIFNQNL